MPIIKERETLLLNAIKNLLTLPTQAFSKLSEVGQTKDKSILKSIIALEKLMEDIYHKDVDLAISNFALAPLGKDLRRNIAYLFIAKEFRNIMNNAYSIAKYYDKAILGIEKNTKSSSIKQDSNLEWLVELSKKICRRLTILEKLLDTEDVKIANKLIQMDSSINNYYHESIEKIMANKNKFKDKELAGFIISSKNFEICGDTIKEIANQVKFIITGRY